jgi:23S rRNA (uracil1939-C5)-methyltransferase
MRKDLDVARRDLFDSPLGAHELEKFGAVVLDPPRSGAKAQAEQLARSKVPVIIYVSCNPSTFARDAALLAAGGYKLASLQTIDQFLWSAHIELVGIFRR